MHAGYIGVISKSHDCYDDTCFACTLTFRKIDFPEPYMAKSSYIRQGDDK